MEEIYTNIYRESRKKAGLEQSEAELVFLKKPLKRFDIGMMAVDG